MRHFPPFLTEDQLAAEAYGHTGFTLDAAGRAMAMIEFVRQNYYHIVSPDIQEACRRQAGMEE